MQIHIHSFIFGILFRTKFRGIDSEWFPLFRGRKRSFRGIPRFKSIPKLGTERNDMKKLVLQKNLLQQTVLTACLLPRHASERNSERFAISQQPPQVATNFVPRKGIPSYFLFRGMVWNRVPRVCFYFCFTVQNSKHFSPLRNGSERNSESFLFRGTAGIPPEQTSCSVNSVFRGIIFCRKLPTLADGRGGGGQYSVR